MNGTTLPRTKTYSSNYAAEDLYGEIEAIQTALDRLKEKVLSHLSPKYGSNAWWEKSDKEALGQIRAGKGITFKKIEDLEKYLGL